MIPWRGPAENSNGQPTFTSYLVLRRLLFAAADHRGAEARHRSRALQGSHRHRRRHRRRAEGSLHDAVPAEARSTDPKCTRTSSMRSWRIDRSSARRAWVTVGARDRRGRRSSASPGAFLNAWLTGAVALVAAALLVVAVGGAVRARHLDSGHRPDARAGVRLRRRSRVEVLRRRAREAPGQEAVLAIRLEGRLRPAGRESVARRARRRAPPHDGAVLRHPRLHDDVGKGHARRRRRPAESAVHAHGGRGVRAPRHGR